MTLHRLNVSRALAFMLAALALVGCSSRQGSDWGEVYSMGTRLLSFEHSRVAMKQAAAIPYASIGVSIDGGSEGMLVLATDNGHEQLWTSASHMALLIRNGRIVRSAGLDHDLTDARLISGDAELSTTAAGSSRWELDFADLGLMSIPVDCTSVVRGPASVQNFNVKIQTIRVDENCHSSEIDWDFTNSYWISPATGIVWHAIQYVNPKLGPIETEILRQPGR